MKTFIINILTIFIFILFTNKVSAQDKGVVGAVNTVINNYLVLESSLAAGNDAASEANAKTLLASIGKIDVKRLSAQEAALLPKLEFDSRHISEVNNIPHQREHFAALSNNLYSLIKSLKVNNQVLYRQYCSMTKRYFLTKAEKVKDPYMGMDNCSKVTETLPAKK